MSLKTFHLFFITLSVFTAFGFSLWLAKEFTGNGEIIFIAYAAISAIAGISLIYYCVRFLHKLKHVSYL